MQGELTAAGGSGITSDSGGPGAAGGGAAGPPAGGGVDWSARPAGIPVRGEGEGVGRFSQRGDRTFDERLSTQQPVQYLTGTTIHDYRVHDQPFADIATAIAAAAPDSEITATEGNAFTLLSARERLAERLGRERFRVIQPPDNSQVMQS